MRAWWSRVPRDTRVAAVLAVLVLLQTVALAAFGLAAANSQRAEAERSLRTLSDWALARGLAEPVAAAVARVEEAVAAAGARAPAAEAAAIPLDHLPFGNAFALLPDGRVLDAAGRVVVPADPAAAAASSGTGTDARLAELEEAARVDGDRRVAAREAFDAGRGAGDPAEAAAAYRLAARAALRAGEDSLALRAADALLEGPPAPRESDAYPWRPGAAAVAAAVHRRRLESGAPDAAPAFAAAALRWRREILAAAFPPEAAAAESAAVREEVAGVAHLLPPEGLASLEAGLDGLDAAERAAAPVRVPGSAAALRGAARAGGPAWVLAPGGSAEPDLFCAVAAADGGTAAFRASAAEFRAALLLPLLRGLALREGVAVRLMTRDRRPVDGAGPPPPAGSALATRALPLPGGEVLAEASLADPGVLESDAARARNLVLGVFAAAALALGLGSLLVLRMVRAEVRLARMKADFVSSVSHDLKTPLTSIRMFLETLREGRARTERERRECLEVVDREAERLERLVQRVLDFSRQASGGRPVRPVPEDPAAVLDETARVFRGRILNGECDFLVEAAAGLPETPLDRDAVVQVLLNLLENAYKYTPASGKRIAMRAAASPGGGLRLEVEDNGPGIPAAERERVFDDFYRLERPGTEGTGGTGLGLALVRRLVLAHGGAVRVEPGREGGSRFVVDLPAAPAGPGGRG